MGASGIGVLLANLGSPDAPTPKALRRYLRQFLSDRRVIDLPRVLWWPILHGIILNLRPAKSARLYASIWGPEGAPLLATGRRQMAALRQRLPDLSFALGMRYGNPSIQCALEELRDAGCERILVLPLYPQYFSGTTGSTFDAVAATLSTWRHVPELRFSGDYHQDDGYVAALATSVREVWEREGEPDRLLLSFHGIPIRYANAGDPYPKQCRHTARLLAEALGLDDVRCQIAFQSRFGREKWIEPYTDHTLESWGRAGVQSVDVLCPGFAADCLETLEEIDILNRKRFLAAGGKRFRYIAALNDRPAHVQALVGILHEQLAGWLPAPNDADRRSPAGP